MLAGIVRNSIERLRKGKIIDIRKRLIELSCARLKGFIPYFSRVVLNAEFLAVTAPLFNKLAKL